MARAVLLVDPDERALRVYGDRLASDGYEIKVGSGRQACERLSGFRPDVLVLCTKVPWTILLLRALRAGKINGADPRLPVLLIGANRESEIVHCLDAGADRTVPSEASEHRVEAEVRALLRRCCDQTGMPKGVLQVGNVRIDRDSRSAEVAGRFVHLTPTEFGVLEVLALESGRAIERAWLIERVWGGIVSSACLRVHVARLRRVLLEAGATAVVENKHGIGWRLVVETKCKERAKEVQRKRKDRSTIERDRDREVRLAG